ncbi:MAG: hypothetical protein E4G94_03510 [ANME-2 cluster archaeon]|nr:MAG: hypothetical protein E4G94_03510 [ANME-2 cluster archaeon]
MPDIDIKRGYEVLPDNNVRFGIRITNNTDDAISDVEIILDYTESLFDLEGGKVQKLGNIPPTIPRTAKYLLKPLGCVHKENIEATILYRDHKWEKHVVTMRPKEVHCVCPFLKEKTITQNEFYDLSNAGHSVEAGLNFQGVNVEQLTSFMTQICKNRLYKVDEYSIEGGKILYLAGESVGEKAYYLLTAFIKENEGLMQVMLRAVSDKPHGLNGFLNEIVDNLRHVVSTVQSAREIGVIKKEQVINIIDSVVQRTTFAGVEGSTSVNIKDSVVQRTEIKGDEKKKISEEERLRKEREKQGRIAREREELNPQKKKDGFSFKKFFAVALVLGVLLLGYWVLEPGATDGPETLESSPLPTLAPTVSPTPTITPAVIRAQPTVSISSETAIYSIIAQPVKNLPNGYELLGTYPDFSEYDSNYENIINSSEGIYKDQNYKDVYLDVLEFDTESNAINFIEEYKSRNKPVTNEDIFSTITINGQSVTRMETYTISKGTQEPRYSFFWNDNNYVYIVKSNSNLENSALDLATAVATSPIL